MIKDRGQKELLYRHFRAQGWMAQIEVPVLAERGVSRNAPPVTDVDVLGIRPSSELRWRLVVGDCKTKKKESPVNRVLWASGLMGALRAATGIVLLRRDSNSAIERDHKLFADEQRILLLEEEEFDAYDKAVVHPAGSSDFPESLDVLDRLRGEAPEMQPRVRDYARWIMSDAWTTTDHATLLRTVLGRAREIRGEIDPNRTDHLALILETGAAFAVPFATLVGTVFRRYIKPNDRNDLDEAARVIIWGGRDRYEFYNRMRADLVQAKGLGSHEPLGLPEWERFLELLRASLEAPLNAFRCPQTLRTASLRVFAGESRPLGSVGDRNLLHLAMRLALYVARAASLPPDAGDKLKALFLTRINEIVESSTSEARGIQLTLGHANR